MSTILVVDDDPSCRDLLRRLLPRMGHTVVVATNGRDALEVLETQKPQLILLDLAMPQMDGLSFLRVLRQTAEFHDTPVILVSGLASRETVRIASGLGVRDYLVKSEFTAQVLCERISKYLTCTPERTNLTATPSGMTESGQPATAQ
jgi:CheY-like chemotaxis protein